MVYFPPANSHSLWNSVSNTLRDANTRSWILLNPTSLGDTWIVCALAKAFRETHGPITMVVKESHAAIAQMYQNDIFKIIAVDGNQIQDYCSRTHHFCTFAIDQPFIAHPFWVGDGRLDRIMQLYRYPGRGGITFTDVCRYILHLGWDAPLARPTIPQAWTDEAHSYAQSIGMVPGKSVILSPDNNSVEALPVEFWQPLADELNRLGWKVFTNLAGNTANGPRSAPFEGTSAITLPLHLVIPLVELAGRYISGNNGLACMLIGSHAKCQFTWLINRRDPSKIYSINGTVYNDPVVDTSIRIAGVTNEPTREYVVCPDEDMSNLIRDIAEDNPASALSSAASLGLPE